MRFALPAVAAICSAWVRVMSLPSGTPACWATCCGVIPRTLATMVEFRVPELGDKMLLTILTWFEEFWVEGGFEDI